ncbi:hypothetical protein MUK42_34955 [Musa troglodytarum]|uniref:Uncharacterized protein n=1 Tax=Musa troglodytarum TaxID=320322 RepID=A0A9E7FY21_9LILI|nr:hypothetical protein MUK42_34955 [Musa troglodytarum]
MYIKKRRRKESFSINFIVPKKPIHCRDCWADQVLCRGHRKKGHSDAACGRWIRKRCGLSTPFHYLVTKQCALPFT